MRIALMLGLVAMLSMTVQSQKPIVSGYLGKTNYGMVKFNTGLRVEHPEKWKKNTEVSSDYFTGVDFKSEFEMVYGHIFSNRFIVEGIAGLNTTSIDLNNMRSAFSYSFPSGFRSEYFNYFGYPKITDVYGGINTKFYRRKKGALAPIGVYYGLGLNFHTYTVHLNNITAQIRDYNLDQIIATQMNYGEFSYNLVELSGSFGATSALTDYLLLDVGFSVGWVFSGSNYYENEIPEESGFDSGLLEMLQLYQIGKLKIGLAYLF